METRVTLLKVTVFGALFCAVVAGFAIARFMFVPTDAGRNRYHRISWVALVGWAVATVAATAQLYWLR